MSCGRERSEAPEGAQRSGCTGAEKTAAGCVERRPQCRAGLRSHSAAQDCETRNGATKRRRKFAFLCRKTVTSGSREEVFGRRAATLKIRVFALENGYEPQLRRSMWPSRRDVENSRFCTGTPS